MPRLATSEIEEVKSDTRLRLLDAAADEFAEHGFAGANVNRISQAAGFGKGTIYNYFTSKRTLMLAVIEHIAAIHTTYIFDSVMKVSGSQARLRCFFSEVYAFVNQHPKLSKVAINLAFGHDEDFRDQVFSAYGKLLTLVENDIIKLGLDEGIFSNLDTDFATAMLMSLYLGSTSLLDPKGQVWMDPKEVANFILYGLLGESRTIKSKETS